MRPARRCPECGAVIETTFCQYVHATLAGRSTRPGHGGTKPRSKSLMMSKR